MEGGDLFEDEFQVQRTNGSSRMRSAGHVKRGASEGSSIMFGVVADFAESEKAAAVLGSFVAGVPAAVAMLDMQMRYLAASRRWIEDYGLDPQALIGRSHYDVLPDLPKRWKEVHRRALCGETITADEDRFDRADGSVLWLQWQISPWTSESGQLGGIIMFATDITQRKQAEIGLLWNAQLNELLSRSAARLLEGSDIQASVESICRETMSFLKCDVFFNYLKDERVGRLHLNASAGISLQDARNMEWLDLGKAVCGRAACEGQRIIVERISCGDDPMTALVKSHGIEAYCCHPLMAQDGVVGTLSFGTRTRSSFSNDEVGAMKAVADLVSVAIGRIRMKRALRESREQTQAALALSQRMDALGQLAGGIAHDSNNLLTVISGNLELARAKCANVDAKRAIGQAIDAVEMGASLNRRLLSFARRRTLATQRVDLNDRVGEMLQLLRRTLGELIEIEAPLDADLWPTRADPGEVDSAIVNIAVNARDAMPTGGKLSIATANVVLEATKAHELDVQPGDYVCLTMTDTGRGMTPEVLRKAIEPFFTTKEVGKGTGLGLSSVYGFARQSGGFVDISSEVGRGTEVRICLPRAVEAERMAAKSEAELPTGDAQLVLVVEDNDQVREVTLCQLEALGYTVLEARGGSDAIEVLKRESDIELVFSDVVMPGGMSGYDVAEWVRTHRPGVKVLLASGNVDFAADRPPDAELRVLAKPYMQATLAHAVRELLDS